MFIVSVQIENIKNEFNPLHIKFYDIDLNIDIEPFVYAEKQVNLRKNIIKTIMDRQ